MDIKPILLVILVLFLASSGCFDNKKEIQLEKYENCTAACSAVISEEASQDGDEFTILYLCNEECKRKFLE